MEKYSKIRHLGKGNMGTVILVRNNAEGKVFVMKLIDLSKMGRKEKEGAISEARVLSATQHVNIIQFVEWFLSPKNDQLFIVMEHAEGGDLSNKVKLQYGRHFSEEQILDWFIQICLAVQFCHQKRVLHRDIKTQNIFLTNNGVIRVGDFGISRVLKNSFENAHTFVGTPYYLSPELVQEKPYNTASDCWAVGVVLYELMALRHPFNATDMKGLMYKIVRVMYDPPPLMYSEGLRAIVTGLLVKDPNKRLKISQILQLPVVQKRISQWLDPRSGDVTVPRSYIESAYAQGLLRPNPESVDEDEYFEEDLMPAPFDMGPSGMERQRPRRRKVREQRQKEPSVIPEPSRPPLAPVHLPELAHRPIPEPPAGRIQMLSKPVAPMPIPDINGVEARKLPPIPLPMKPGFISDQGIVPSSYHPPPPVRMYRRNLDPLGGPGVGLQPQQPAPSVVSGFTDNSKYSHYYYEARKQADLNRIKNVQHRAAIGPSGVLQHNRVWKF
eukprot:TRINITY_DN95428_c0_g1_i1.p1 TRINITY_DN95428_c0_g1~~TRINITY_DN95428_c0_g1_i1.p1  ORF type:complete len:497 (+),score=67.15 TRINITY_DN95428_c0_g1_i1:119-1609(+)